MKIFRKLNDYYRYQLDSLKTSFPTVKIERFDIDVSHHKIIAVYRIGRNKLLNKMPLQEFEHEFFEKISSFDQHRLTKFGILQTIMQELFSQNTCSKGKFIKFIHGEANHDQLF
jgi:hypothetical protein